MAAEPDVVGEPSPGADAGLERGPGLRRTLAYSLLLFECAVILVPSVYGRSAPTLAGIPFFYWFQLAWILVAMVITGVVYLLTTSRRAAARLVRSRPPAGAGAATPRAGGGPARRDGRGGAA